MQIEELFKKHISDLYLICPTIPPRVLSNDQWWNVIKELCGLCHIIPLLNHDFKKTSLIQIEYLIIQFIQSNPPVLALKWLMNLYSLISKYIKLSVGRLLSEIILLLNKFTGIDIYEIDKKKINNLNINIYQYSELNNISNNNILDISDLSSRDIQPSHIITSLYIIQVLLRIEILETRKDIPIILKYLPKLIIHIDPTMRDASNECLLSILMLGIPSYSIANNLIDFLIPSIKILMELDDSLNIERIIQSIINIFNQFPKIADLKKQEILQLIVNISSSLITENNNIIKNNHIIESISNLLSNSTIISIFFYKNKNIIDVINYLTNIINIQFSTYGLGSYPINGEYFRIIITNSIISILKISFNQNLLNIIEIEEIWKIILNNFQIHFIRKHITENLQWLTNNHWVFLWKKIIKYILYYFIINLQLYIKEINNNDKKYIIIWTKFEQFINQLSQISPKICLECMNYLFNIKKDINWFWNFNNEFKKLFIKWLFNISLIENFEMSFNSYLSGKLCGYLINNSIDNSYINDINFIFEYLINLNDINILLNQKNNDIIEKLTHNIYFLIGLSNSTLLPIIIIIILENINQFLFNSYYIQLLNNKKLINEEYFILNNIFLLIKNLLSNIIYIIRFNNIKNMNDLNLIINKLLEFNYIWKNILCNKTIDIIITIIKSITESIEKIQILKENNELNKYLIYEDEKDNPLLLLFKDLKQWLSLIWITIELIQVFIKLEKIVNNYENNELNKLNKFLTKFCFNIINKLFPIIPRSWMYFIPEKKEIFLEIEDYINYIINDEFNLKISSRCISIDDFNNILINKEFNNNMHVNNGINNEELNNNYIQTIEKFNFPYIGDINCFSKTIHISILIMLLKLSVYKQLNNNLFKYINHPPISNNIFKMLILELNSKPILKFDIRFPNEIFLINKLFENNNIRSINLINNNIFLINEDFNLINEYNNTYIILKYGIFESMKDFISFPLIYDQLLLNSKQDIEIIYRKEIAKFISNIIFENILIYNDKKKFINLIRIIFKLLYKRTINNINYWNLIISESKYIEKENSKIMIENFYDDYPDLSPTLYLMTLKNIISYSNNIEIIPILSIIWCLKKLFYLIINKLNLEIDNLLINNNVDNNNMHVNNGINNNNLNNNNNNNIKLINILKDCLYYIYSFLFKYLFEFRFQDLKNEILQININKKYSKINSCIIRYYCINFLVSILNYFYKKNLISSYYYLIKEKFENIITWNNYLNNQYLKKNQDNDLLIDIYIFFILIRCKIYYLNYEIINMIDIFIKDNINFNLSLKDKLFIYKINKNINNNCLIEKIINYYFGFDNYNINLIDIKDTSLLIDIYGEYLCFYNYKELINMDIFGYIINIIHNNIRLLLNNILINKFQYKEINSLICISLSLIFNTRINEISLINYNNEIYIPNNCKMIFFNKDFLLDFWKLLLIINNNNIFKKNIINIEDNTNLPIYNFIGLLLINNIFINNDLTFFKNFSKKDFELLFKLDINYLIILLDWILKNKNESNLLLFMNMVFYSLNICQINEIILKLINYLINNSFNIKYKNNINNITNFVINENNNFDLSCYPLYIQLKSFIEINNENQDNNIFNSNIIYNVNLNIITKIIKIISNIIYLKISEIYDYDYILKNKLISYGFNNIYVDNNNMHVNNGIINNNNNNNNHHHHHQDNNVLSYEFIKFVFDIILLLIDICDINYYEFEEECILQDYFIILNNIVFTLFKNSQIFIIKEFFEYIDKIFELLNNLLNKNKKKTILFKLISKFFVNIYFILSEEIKIIIWRIIMDEFLNIEIEFINDENLLYQVILKTKSEDFILKNIIYNKEIEENIILIYLKLAEYFIYKKFLENKSIILFIFTRVGNLLFNIDLKRLNKYNKLKELLNLENLKIIIENIFNKSNNLFEDLDLDGIYYIPSLISIWNIINNNYEFTNIIIDILIICYNNMNNSIINALLFIIEIISCINYLININNITLNFDNNNLHVDNGINNDNNNNKSFKSLIIKYYNNYLNSDSKTELDFNFYKKDINSNGSILIELLYYFSLEIASFERKDISEILDINEKINEIIIYKKFYILFFNFIIKNDLLNNKKITFIKLTNQKLLTIYKSILKLSFENNSELNKIFNKLEMEYYNLFIENFKILFLNKQYEIIIYTHLFWIEDQMKKSLVLSKKSYNLKFCDKILNILIKLLILIKNFNNEVLKDLNMKDINIKDISLNNLKDLIFKLLRYYLLSPIYVHTYYLEIFNEFLNKYEKEEKKEPDLSEFMIIHEYLQNSAINSILELLNLTDEYNKEIFESIKILLMPFGFSYDLEKDKNELNLLIPIKKSWKILNNLVNSIKNNSVINIKNSELINDIKYFIKNYSEYLNSELSISIPFILPSSLILIWFQNLNIKDGKKTISEFNNYLLINNKIEIDYLEWFSFENYYLPKDNQLIIIEYNKNEIKSKELKEEIRNYLNSISKILD